MTRGGGELVGGGPGGGELWRTVGRVEVSGCRWWCKGEQKFGDFWVERRKERRGGHGRGGC
jgi:hypothetical protein